MVPLIDIEPFLQGGDADKKRTAAALDDACREFGWLVIAGHGVPDALIKEMHGVSRGFFALPHWEKMKHKMPADRYRGYTPPGTESLAYSLDEERPPDLKEAYSMGPVDAAYDEYHYGPAGARYFAPNIWPDRPDDMPGVWEAYYREMTRLSADVMRIFAVALDMPEDFFAPKIDEHITNFSAIYYPSQPDSPLPEQLRGGAHTDYGSLTLVHCDTAVGGLQIQTQDGAWEDVPWFPDSFSVNLGDLMAEWTNDRWRSTMHRIA
ncbi:MAG: isopenicillin N synthase family oxygenase, partial [Rhodospirillales bacterium]|nr:isopenicillin N synthase family oxygenase [Rhodospirillales bacterium]